MTLHEHKDFLKFQLTHFGLNPHDWDLVAESTNKYWIVHSRDPGLKIIGVTTTEPTFRWHQLTFQEL